MIAASSIFGPVSADLARVEEVIASVARVDHPVVRGLLEHILQTKGKRLRPALVLLAGQFHDYCLDRLARLAAAIELLHTATLVHDDLIDSAHTRRGVATLHSLVGGRAAVLVGDYLFARAASLCSDIGSVRVVSVFGETLSTIVEGELRQVFNSGEWRQDRATYYGKIASKTASLFRTSTESGAILSSAPEHVIRALSDYGFNLGLAFQIVDDVLDFVGDERAMGKPVGADLRQGTITLPAICYLENHPEDDTIRRVFESDGDVEAVVQRAVEVVANSPAIDSALGEARTASDKARQAIADLPDGAAREALLNLAEYVVDRVS